MTPDEPGRRKFGTCVCMRKLGLSVSCTGNLLGRPCDDWEQESEPTS